MAQVTVTIDGKAYRMACEEGQQAHLENLALRFDRYVSHLKSQFGEIGDLRLTVMAGIMVMDELSEVGRRLAAVEGELAVLRQSHDGVEQQQQRNDEAVAAALSDLASRLNGITAKLNARPPAATN